ncbi:hypothetical protein, partial [Adlercreutzia sp.]|uniref:hypothetical protein n=1 Tax=Adlercreutzia sp. TaxID=1872387 RepID=UPI002F93D746
GRRGVSRSVGHRPGIQHQGSAATRKSRAVAAPRSARFPREQLSVQVESLPIFEKPAMVDPYGLNVVDGPFLWCGTKPVILGSDYFDYSLAALAIGLQK